MEFNFNTKQLFKCGKDGIGVLHAENIPKNNASNITTVLDNIGAFSAKAQQLKAVITTGSKFIGTDQRIYIKCDNYKVIGFLKVGVKKLFIRDEVGAIDEISPLCVLDFYVFEDQQRSGQGKALFDKMLECEYTEPRKLGYDRPSEKLLSFLSRHFGIKDYVPQNNNFVVFKAYFEDSKKDVKNFNSTKKIVVDYNYDDYDYSDVKNKYEYNKNNISNSSKKNEDNIYTSTRNNNILTNNNKPSQKNKPNNITYTDEFINMNDQFNKIKIDSNKTNSNYTKPSQSNNAPWATIPGQESSYIPTSLSYGAYYIKGNKK